FAVAATPEIFPTLPPKRGLNARERSLSIRIYEARCRSDFCTLSRTGERCRAALCARGSKCPLPPPEQGKPPFLSSAPRFLQPPSGHRPEIAFSRFGVIEEAPAAVGPGLGRENHERQSP